MSHFLSGFHDEIKKLAAYNTGSQSSSNPIELEKKPDLSPVAAAGKNLGIGSPAGQPEQPSGNIARTDQRPKSFGTSRQGAFKASLA